MALVGVLLAGVPLAGLFPAAASTAMPWPSGVSVDTAADATAWATFRGRDVGIVNVYPYRGRGWDSIVNPVEVWNNLAGFHGRVVVSEPFWPENYDNPVNLAHCAQGYYIAQWKRLGTSLVAAGHANAIARIAWEANGTWFPWQATDTVTWKRCFQVTAAAIRSTDPKVAIEWSINNHYSQLPVTTHNAFDLYPGDRFVDVVGMSAYDHYPPARNQAEWDAQFNGSGGLLPLVRFATAHKKKFAVDEWGVAKESAGGGGDNSFYLQQMFNAFSFLRKNLAYETYFNDADPADLLSSLTTPGLNPRSSALYRELWQSAR